MRTAPCADIKPTLPRPFSPRRVEIGLAAVQVILRQRFISIALQQIPHLRDARFVAAPNQTGRAMRQEYTDHSFCVAIYETLH